MRRTVIDAATSNGRGLPAVLDLGCLSLPGASAGALAPTMPFTAVPTTGAITGAPSSALTAALSGHFAGKDANAQGTHPPRESAALL